MDKNQNKGLFCFLERVKSFFTKKGVSKQRIIYVMGTMVVFSTMAFSGSMSHFLLALPLIVGTKLIKWMQ